MSYVESSSLQAEALKRKEKLAALKAKRAGGSAEAKLKDDESKAAALPK